MNICKNCSNKIFDEKWGEYKCTIHEHRIYPDKRMNCNKYTPKKEAEKPNDNRG